MSRRSDGSSSWRSAARGVWRTSWRSFATPRRSTATSAPRRPRHSFSLEQPLARVRHPDDPRCFQPALVGTVVPGRPPRPTWSLHLGRGGEAKHRTDLLLAAYTHASQAPDKRSGVSRDSTVLARMRHFCGVGLPTAMPSDRAVMSLLSTPRARPPLEAVSLSSSSGMVNKFAAPLLRAQPVRLPVLPQSARAACAAFSPDVDADVCRWGDGLHSSSCSSEQAYLADVPVTCSQAHTEPTDSLGGSIALRRCQLSDRGRPAQ